MPDTAGLWTAKVEAMAMPFVVAISRASSDVSDAECAAAAAGVHADLRWADDTFSLWRDDTPMARLARGDLTLDECPPAVALVLDECERYRAETGGFFDARRPGGLLDPTGIVKMWAVVRASRRLEDLQPDGWLIGAAGDVFVAGVGPAGGQWAVGIADPAMAGDPQGGPVIDTVRLGGAVRSVCTSGIAQHGQHLWNPVTGEMRAAYAQVSVTGADAVQCDAWATAVAVGGESAALAAQRFGMDVLCIAAVAPGGEVASVASPGWPGADDEG